MAWGLPGAVDRRSRRRARTAANQQLTSNFARMHRRTRQPWQERSSFFCRNLGVTRFAGGLMADTISRCDPRPEKCVDTRADVWEPVEDNLTADVLHAYKGKSQSQRELIRQHAWHYETIGETLQFVESDGRSAAFGIRSPLAAQWRGDGVLLRDLPGGTERDGTATLVPYSSVKRMWIPDEDWPALATSPMQGVLRDCERYWALTRSIQRVAENALLQNGIIWYPSEADRALPQQQVGPGGPKVPTSSFQQQYLEMAQRALEDDDLIESVVPWLVKWGKDYGKPELQEFKGRLDPEALLYIKETIEAIGRGLDYPQQLLVNGGSDMNHWGAWLMEETFARNAVAPRLERIWWGDITATYFRPVLQAMVAKSLFKDDPAQYRIGFDMSPIVVHPDQSKNALELYKVGALGDTTLLEVSGFDASAAPNRAELGRWIMRTQIQRERITSPTSQALPGDAATVLADTPALSTGTPVVASLGRARELVTAGPFPGEELGWLDQ